MALKRRGRFGVGARSTADPDYGGTVDPDPENTPPVAVSASFSVAVSAGYTGTLSASDADVDPLTYSIVTNGSLGAAVITNINTGAFSYTASSAAGSDSFTFKVNDGEADSNIATMLVTITGGGGGNIAPVASDASFSLTTSNVHNGTLSASDADGDPLTYSIVANGTLGTAVITNTATGAFTYTSGLSAGTDTFTFKVNDGTVDSNTATVIVTVTSTGGGAHPDWSIQFSDAGVGQGNFDRTGTATYYNHTANAAFNRHLTASAADGLPCYEYTLADGIRRGVLVRPPMMELVGADTDDLSTWTVESTSIASVAQNATGINGSSNNAWTLTGTDKTTSNTRYMVYKELAADGIGGLDAESANLSYTGTDPTPGMILMVTNAAATTESGVCYVVSVDGTGKTMQVIMLKGTINNTDTFFEPGSAVVLCTASSALAERTLTALTEPVPMVAWARVKKGTWPFYCIRLRTESNVSQDYLFDIEEGKSYVQETSASLFQSDCYGLKYLNDNFFLIYAVHIPRASSATQPVRMSLGFGKPEAYSANYSSKADRDDLVYGATSGAVARIRRDFESGHNIIYVDHRVGTFTNGEALKAAGTATTVATVVVETAPTYNTSYAWMCVATNAASTTYESVNCAAETLVIQDAGLVRGFHIPRTPVDNTVTFAEPTNPTTYYIQNRETLTFNATQYTYEMPTNNFSLVLKCYNPIREFSTRWRAGVVVAAGAICTPFNIPYTMRCTTGGTTGASEPTWTTITAVDQPKVDNTATWRSYAAHEFYLWSCGTASIRRTRRHIRFYVDATNYLEWAVNDSLLYFKNGTSASVTPTRGNTVTGGTSGATATLLATPALNLDSGTLAGANAKGHLSLRVTSGVFIDGENLMVGASVFATAVGIAQYQNGGVFEEGIYNIGVHKSSTAGAQLWVNGFLVASNETFTASLAIGANWYLGTDTNTVNHGGWITESIRVRSDFAGA